MALLRSKKKKKDADFTPPPPEVIPWRVPPMGSLGDAWDDAIKLPEPKQPAIVDSHAAAKRLRKRKRRDPLDVVFRDYFEPLHLGVTVAWVAIGLALLSTGPLYRLMALFALMAVVAGLLTVALLKTVHNTRTGMSGAVTASILGLLLIFLDLWRPDAYLYESHFIRNPGFQIGVLTGEQRLEKTRENMELMARVALCAHIVMGEDLTAVGNNAVNKNVDRNSIYFRISTLATVGDEESALVQQYLFYTPLNLPRDLFADDPRATFGVYLTANHLIVYSTGPDGEWQINPREPIPSETLDPEAELEPLIFGNPSLPYGTGDLFLIVPLSEVGGGPPVNCDEVKSELEGR